MSLVTGERLISTTEFQVAGEGYIARRLPVMTVVNVGRRMAPVLLQFRSLLAGIASETGRVPAAPDGEAADKAKPAPMPPTADPLAKFVPMVEAISRLSDEDVEHVVKACLSVVQSKKHYGMGSMWDGDKPQAGLVAGEVLAICGHVLGATFAEVMEDLPALGLPGFADMATDAAA